MQGHASCMNGDRARGSSSQPSLRQHAMPRHRAPSTPSQALLEDIKATSELIIEFRRLKAQGGSREDREALRQRVRALKESQQAVLSSIGPAAVPTSHTTNTVTAAPSLDGQQGWMPPHGAPRNGYENGAATCTPPGPSHHSDDSHRRRGTRAGGTPQSTGDAHVSPSSHSGSRNGSRAAAYDRQVSLPAQSSGVPHAAPAALTVPHPQQRLLSHERHAVSASATPPSAGQRQHHTDPAMVTTPPPPAKGFSFHTPPVVLHGASTAKTPSGREGTTLRHPYDPSSTSASAALSGHAARTPRERGTHLAVMPGHAGAVAATEDQEAWLAEQARVRRSVVFAITLAESHTRKEIQHKWERKLLRRYAEFREGRVEIALSRGLSLQHPVVAAPVAHGETADTKHGAAEAVRAEEEKNLFDRAAQTRQAEAHASEVARLLETEAQQRNEVLHDEDKARTSVGEERERRQAELAKEAEAAVAAAAAAAAVTAAVSALLVQEAEARAELQDSEEPIAWDALQVARESDRLSAAQQQADREAGEEAERRQQAERERAAEEERLRLLHANQLHALEREETNGRTGMAAGAEREREDVIQKAESAMTALRAQAAAEAARKEQETQRRREDEQRKLKQQREEAVLECVAAEREARKKHEAEAHHERAAIEEEQEREQRRHQEAAAKEEALRQRQARRAVEVTEHVSAVERASEAILGGVLRDAAHSFVASSAVDSAKRAEEAVLGDEATARTEEEDKEEQEWNHLRQEASSSHEAARRRTADREAAEEAARQHEEEMNEQRQQTEAAARKSIEAQESDGRATLENDEADAREDITQEAEDDKTLRAWSAAEAKKAEEMERQARARARQNHLTALLSFSETSIGAAIASAAASYDAARAEAVEAVEAERRAKEQAAAAQQQLQQLQQQQAADRILCEQGEAAARAAVAEEEEHEREDVMQTCQASRAAVEAQAQALEQALQEAAATAAAALSADIAECIESEAEGRALLTQDEARLRESSITDAFQSSRDAIMVHEELLQEVTESRFNVLAAAGRVVDQVVSEAVREAATKFVAEAETHVGLQEEPVSAVAGEASYAPSVEVVEETHETEADEDAAQSERLSEEGSDTKDPTIPVPATDTQSPEGESPLSEEADDTASSIATSATPTLTAQRLPSPSVLIQCCHGILDEYLLAAATAAASPPLTRLSPAPSWKANHLENPLSDGVDADPDNPAAPTVDPTLSPQAATSISVSQLPSAQSATSGRAPDDMFTASQETASVLGQIEPYDNDGVPVFMRTDNAESVNQGSVHASGSETSSSASASSGSRSPSRGPSPSHDDKAEGEDSAVEEESTDAKEEAGNTGSYDASAERTTGHGESPRRTRSLELDTPDGEDGNGEASAAVPSPPPAVPTPSLVTPQPPVALGAPPPGAGEGPASPVALPSDAHPLVATETHEPLATTALLSEATPEIVSRAAEEVLGAFLADAARAQQQLQGDPTIPACTAPALAAGKYMPDRAAAEIVAGYFTRGAGSVTTTTTTTTDFPAAAADVAALGPFEGLTLPLVESTLCRGATDALKAANEAAYYAALPLTSPATPPLPASEGASAAARRATPPPPPPPPPETLPQDWQLSCATVAERLAADFYGYVAEAVLAARAELALLGGDTLRSDAEIDAAAMAQAPHDPYHLFSSASLRKDDLIFLSVFYMEMVRSRGGGVNGGTERGSIAIAVGAASNNTTSAGGVVEGRFTQSIFRENLFYRGEMVAGRPPKPQQQQQQRGIPRRISEPATRPTASASPSVKNPSRFTLSTDVRRAGVTQLVLEHALENVMHDLIGDAVGWLGTLLLDEHPGG